MADEQHQQQPTFSDYIVYVDESGDHGMTKTDPQYPIFVLAFCLMHKEQYISDIVPRLQRFKYKHFGHDMAVLHEHEMRKATGDFTFLQIRERREVFMTDINELVEKTKFTVIAAVVLKDRLGDKPPNPYHLALCYGLEQVDRFLLEHEGGEKRIHFVFEARGEREDKDLELEFRRICDGANCRKACFNFVFVLAHKRVNSCGLQLADLMARPIGLKVLRPDQPNRAFDLIEPKLQRGEGESYEGVGLKILP